MKKIVSSIFLFSTVLLLYSCSPVKKLISGKNDEKLPETVIQTVIVTVIQEPETEQLTTESIASETEAAVVQETKTEQLTAVQTTLNTETTGFEDPRIGTPFDRKVVVSDASAGIYLRPEPDLDAEHLILIPKNEIITVYSCKTPGWFYTTYNGTSGYIYVEYTKDPNTSVNSDSRYFIGTGRVSVSAASAGIYLRPYANLDAEHLLLIPKNEIISLYSCDSDGWYYTYYDGKEGYVYADYISMENNYYYDDYENVFLGYGTVTVSAASAGIYLRPYCDLDAEYLALIPKNLSIPLYSSGNTDWYYTCYDGQWGYVYADYVK